MAEYYMWIKAFHLIFVISWMCGLLYLPRLFAYHANTITGSELDQTFKTMENRLLKIIMNPAMIMTYILGILLAMIYGFNNLGVWFHYKVLFVLILSTMHGIMVKWKKDFAIGRNIHSNKFYRIINEVPALIMICIVILVIVKPFED
ncbi:MAG: protoporphyrinogen oxidase HemJ [Alphaproteobacteria bacterium]